jgi:hypothetical protein
MALGQPGLILADEPPQLLVAADLACAGVVDHHLARPHSLQSAGVTFVQRGEVLRDRISLVCGASLPACQLHGAGEFRKPRQRNPYGPLPAGQFLQTAVLCPPCRKGSVTTPSPVCGQVSRSSWRMSGSDRTSDSYPACPGPAVRGVEHHRPGAGRWAWG